LVWSKPSGASVRLARFPAPGLANDDAVDGDTIYEIGGISKVFTALLLTDMVHRGEVSLNDPGFRNICRPIRRCRSMRCKPDDPAGPRDAHVGPAPDAQQCRAGSTSTTPNADMNADQLLKSVSAYELTRAVGSGYEIFQRRVRPARPLPLAIAGHTDFETMLKARILRPASYGKTPTSPYRRMRRINQSSGYDMHLSPVPRANIPSVLGRGMACGRRQTTCSISLAANIGLVNTPLAPAMGDMLKTVRPTQYEELKIRAWAGTSATLDGVEMVWGKMAGPRGIAPLSASCRNCGSAVVVSVECRRHDRRYRRSYFGSGPGAEKPCGGEAPDRHQPVSIIMSAAIWSAENLQSARQPADGNRLYIQGTGEQRGGTIRRGRRPLLPAGGQMPEVRFSDRRRGPCTWYGRLLRTARPYWLPWRCRLTGGCYRARRRRMTAKSYQATAQKRHRRRFWGFLVISTGL